MTCVIFTSRYRHMEFSCLFESLEYQIRRAKMAASMVRLDRLGQPRKKLEPELPARDNSCSKHTWVYYHSSGTRECIDCPRVEKLWADFGLTKRTEQ